MRAIVRVAAIAAAAAALLGAATLPAGAAGAKLVADGGFEKPKLKVPQESLVGGPDVFFGGKCIPGTAHGCWGLGAGTIDIVSSSVWQPKAGNQSIDLNSGSEAASVAQALFTTAGQKYRVTFWLAATPGAPDNVNLAAFWGNIDAHGQTISTDQFNFDFAPFGHTSTSMGWTKETFVDTAVPTSAEVRIYFQSTTDLGAGEDDFGPVIDAVSVKPI